MKQARVDAEREVSAFRAEKEKEYEEYKVGQNSGADAENAELARETDKLLDDLKSLTSKRVDKVTEMLINHIVSVKL